MNMASAKGNFLIACPKGTWFLVEYSARFAMLAAIRKSPSVEPKETKAKKYR